jgi:hypothetical protein
MIEKPAYGQPCNRCGQCCRAMLCPLGAAVFRRKYGPCPALETQASSETACGLVAHPGEYRPVQMLMHGAEKMRDAALLLIGARINGCDALLAHEPDDPVFAAKVRSFSSNDRRHVGEALHIWGFRNERASHPRLRPR